MLNHALRLLCAVVLITLNSLVVSAQQYPVRLDRIEKAGDRYHLTASATTSSTTDIAVSEQFQRTAEDVLTVELSADVTILDATSKWATRKRFRVLSSKLTRTNKTRLLLPNGTEVIASIENGQTVYHVNGKAVEAEVARALRSIISLHLASVADDDMFGTTTPRKIGESWPIGVDAMKKLLKEIGAQGGRQEITGSGMIEKVAGHHIFVRSLIKVRDVLWAIAPDVTTEAGEIETELSGRYPYLSQDQTQETAGRIYLYRVGSEFNEEGKKVKLKIVFESKSRYEIRPLRRVRSKK